MAEIHLGTLVYDVVYRVKGDQAMRDKAAVERGLTPGRGGSTGLPSASNISGGLVDLGSSGGNGRKMGGVNAPNRGGGAGGGGPPSSMGITNSKIWDAGQTNIMGTGMFMNFLFGGWEVASSFNARAAANRFSVANPNDLQGQMKAWNTAIDKMTAGPMGSIVSVLGGVDSQRNEISNITAAATVAENRISTLQKGSDIRKEFGRKDELAAAETDLARSIIKVKHAYEDREKVVKDQSREEKLSAKAIQQASNTTANDLFKTRMRAEYVAAAQIEGYIPQEARLAAERDASISASAQAYQRSVNAANAREAGAMPMHTTMLKQASRAFNITDNANRADMIRDNALNNAAINLNNSIGSRGFASFADEMAAMKASNAANEKAVLAKNGIVAFSQLGRLNKSAEAAAQGAQDRNERVGMAGAVGALRVNTLLNSGRTGEAISASAQAQNNADFEGAGTAGEKLNALVRGAARVMGASTERNQNRKAMEEDRDRLIAQRDRIIKAVRFGGQAVGTDSPDAVNFKGGAMPNGEMQKVIDVLEQINSELIKANTNIQNQ